MDSKMISKAHGKYTAFILMQKMAVLLVSLALFRLLTNIDLRAEGQVPVVRARIVSITRSYRDSSITTIDSKNTSDSLLADVKKWDKHLSPKDKSRPDWMPRKRSPGGKFVRNLWKHAAKKYLQDVTCNLKSRIGKAHDGGKIICVPKIRKENCIVYSLGSRLDFSFEVDIIKKFNCEVHTFDCTVGDPPADTIPKGVTFHPWCVGGKDEKKVISSDLGHQGERKQYYKLSTIYAKLGHNASQIDLLKMDIERHEIPVLIDLSERAAPNQIAVELHIHNAYGMFGSPLSKNEWRLVWDNLRRLGYGVLSYEPNPYCPGCCEYTLLKNVS